MRKRIKLPLLLLTLLSAATWGIALASSGLLQGWLEPNLSPIWNPRTFWKYTVKEPVARYAIETKTTYFPVPGFVLVVDDSVCKDLAAFKKLVIAAAITPGRVSISVLHKTCTPEQFNDIPSMHLLPL
jgi:hypothetical protein